MAFMRSNDLIHDFDDPIDFHNKICRGIAFFVLVALFLSRVHIRIHLHAAGFAVLFSLCFHWNDLCNIDEKLCQITIMKPLLLF